MPRILFVFGTRPEAIKLAPLVLEMRANPRDFDPRICVTAQHRAMLDQVLDAYAMRPDHDLDLMSPDQTLFQTTARAVGALEQVLEIEQPDMVIVQGDTTTTFCGALAAFYRRIPVAHVEAGLRTGDRYAPFPEEMNRVLTSRLAALHFAPTARSKDNLLAEGVPDVDITVTGNTGIDAVLWMRDALEEGRVRPDTPIATEPSRKLILVTAHRRESFGEGFERICRALAMLADRNDVQIVYPVHPNPQVEGPVRRHLENRSNILLTKPLGYVEFVDLARRAHVLLTDSGGVQEEGPSLGKPVLVMRDKTERPEAVEAGTAVLVGTTIEAITGETARLLDDPAEHARRSRIHNPYGDGRACKRILSVIRSYFSTNH